MAAFLLSTWRQGHCTLSECRPWLWRLLIQKVVQVASHTTFRPGWKWLEGGWLWIWQTLAVALDVRSNAGFDMAWLLLMPGCGFWFFWCYLWLVHPRPYHITTIQHMYIYHVVRKNRQATIEIYWTTDSSWKNAALATKVLHPNCSSV